MRVSPGGLMCRQLLLSVAGVFILFAVMGWNGASARESVGAEAQGSVSLIDLWLAYPGMDDIAWPYAYISGRETRELWGQRKRELVDELEALRWRLEDAGRMTLYTSVGRWLDRIRDMHSFILPGDWSPGWLMAHPGQRPPADRVQVLGSCQRPDWVEIWDAGGLRRVKWQPGLRLSRLLYEQDTLDGGGSPYVNVVSQYGVVEKRGIQAWNFEDAELAPGTRIVARLPLDGDAFPWIQSAIARLLAHIPPGDHCRERSPDSLAHNE